jgi:hypothetical protein
MAFIFAKARLKAHGQNVRRPRVVCTTESQYARPPFISWRRVWRAEPVKDVIGRPDGRPCRRAITSMGWVGTPQRAFCPAVFGNSIRRCQCPLVVRGSLRKAVEGLSDMFVIGIKVPASRSPPRVRKAFVSGQSIAVPVVGLADVQAVGVDDVPESVPRADGNRRFLADERLGDSHLFAIGRLKPIDFRLQHLSFSLQGLASRRRSCISSRLLRGPYRRRAASSRPQGSLSTSGNIDSGRSLHDGTALRWSPRRAGPPAQCGSSAENCRRVARRVSFTIFSAGAWATESGCYISPPRLHWPLDARNTAGLAVEKAQQPMKPELRADQRDGLPGPVGSTAARLFDSQAKSIRRPAKSKSKPPPNCVSQGQSVMPLVLAECILCRGFLRIYSYKSAAASPKTAK